MAPLLPLAGRWRTSGTVLDERGRPGPMQLGEEGPGVLLAHGDGVRSRLVVGDDHMSAHWDGGADGRWQPWTDMAFERL